MPLPPVDAWKPINLSLIVFTLDPAVQTGQHWMRDVAGDEGESVRKGLERTDTGIVDSRMVRLHIDPLRIMWTAAPALEPEAALHTIPSIGTFTAAYDWFFGLVEPWLLQHCPPIRRIAFSGKLFQDAPTKEDAYRRLDEYLTHVSVDPNSSDFQFRVNRQRDSLECVQGLCVNRLCTWSAMKFHMALNVTAGADTQSMLGDNVFGSLLQLDVNTDADRTEELPSTTRQAILSELRQLSVEIATQGDIP